MIVRVVVVFPFVLLCALGWAVIGLFFWIPTFIFATIEYQFSIFRHLMTGRSPDTEMEAVRAASEYYTRGFSIILGVLAQRGDQSPGTREKASSPSLWSDFEEIAKPLVQKLLTSTVAWAAGFFVWYFAFGSPELLRRLVALIAS